MTENTHDPREHIRGLHQILINDKKRIGFLFGAGTSLATGVEGVSVPAIEPMTKIVVEKVVENSKEFAAAVESIRDEIEVATRVFNIESLLSVVEAKRAVVGAGELNGLNFAALSELIALVKKAVVELVSVHDKLTDIDRRKLAHANLANWIQKARRRYPAEIFTTNYDYLFEISLEGAGTPYFDGFAGSFEPFFCPEAVEDVEAYAKQVKLWKMHGSLGWVYRKHDHAVIRNPSAPGDEILIYPSHLKYSSSKKQPYIGLIDRLCEFLQQDDAVLFTCGYSFGDDHINERIVTSLRRGGNSHVVAMLYDEVRSDKNELSYGLEDESNGVRVMATNETGGKMSVFGCRHAVIGGKFGEWKLRTEPQAADSIQVDQYFDEDAAMPSDESGEHKGDESWQGAGRFLLPDFRMLADFLNSLSSNSNPTGSK